MELLKGEYEKCKRDTNNFTILSGSMLLNNEHYLELIRKICNITISDFDQIYFEEYGKRFRSSNYELYYPSRKLGKKLAERLAQILMDRLKKVKDINFDLIRQYTLRVKNNRESYSKGADFESLIESYLFKNKIQFEKHPRLVGKSGIFHKVDFLIGDRLNPRIVLEVKKSDSMKHNFMSIAKELVATSIDLDMQFGKYLVILDTQWNDNSRNFLKHYCKTFNISEIEEVIKFIKSEKGM